MADVPVTAKVIKWARRFRNLDLQEAARMLRIRRDTLRAIESGDSLPTLTIFRNMARKYYLPEATLSRRTIPTTPKAPKDYRTIEGESPELSFETLVAIGRIYELQDNLQRIGELTQAEQESKLRRYSERSDPSTSGEQERVHLNISLIEQLGWRNAEESFRQWRISIERLGICVHLDKFPLSDCRAFSIQGQTDIPAIVINKAEESFEARIFSLVHEYAHLLIRRPGLSDQSSNNRVESYCNRFAAGLLMPSSMLVEIVSNMKADSNAWSMEEVRGLAKRLKVSQQALSLRLQALNLATTGLFDRVKKEQGKARKKRKSGGGNYNNTMLFELGTTYLRKVISAHDSGIVGAANAASMLSMAPRYFTKIRTHLSGLK